MIGFAAAPPGADPGYSMALLLSQAVNLGLPPSAARLPMTPEEVAASYATDPGEPRPRTLPDPRTTSHPNGTGASLSSPLQAHRHENGFWYVVEGEFAAQAGDEEVREGPGALIFPPGIPHAYWNHSPATKISRVDLSISWLAVRLIGRLSGN